MSLILEALRKSEAERQIGRAPGLLTPMPRTQPMKLRRWPWLLLIAALIGGASAAAWWLGRQGAATGLPTTTTEPVPAVASTSGPNSDAIVAPALPAPTAATRPVSTTPTPTLPAAGPSDLPGDAGFSSIERESVALPAPTVAPPAPLTPPVATASAPSTTPIDPASDSTQAPVTLADPSEQATPVEPFISSLRTLGAAEREALPPLRLNMHVFSDAPEQRFVMIDGRRLSEGETVASGIVVTQIRRDGAVLDVRGRMLLLERP